MNESHSQPSSVQNPAEIRGDVNKQLEEMRPNVSRTDEGAIPSFHTERFRAIAVGHPFSLALGTGLILLVAVGVGLLASLLSQLRYVVVVYPLGMGGLIAATGPWAMRLGRFRGRVILVLVGLAVGLTANLSMHFFNCLRSDLNTATGLGK